MREAAADERRRARRRRPESCVHRHRPCAAESPASAAAAIAEKFSDGEFGRLDGGAVLQLVQPIIELALSFFLRASEAARLAQLSDLAGDGVSSVAQRDLSHPRARE